MYDHYFNTFLRPTDVLWSSVEVVVVALMIMLVCTYYGYAAHGGPAGLARRSAGPCVPRWSSRRSQSLS